MNEGLYTMLLSIKANKCEGYTPKGEFANQKDKSCIMCTHYHSVPFKNYTDGYCDKVLEEIDK